MERALFEWAGAGEWTCRPERLQLPSWSGLAVRHRVVAAELDETVVQSLGEQVVIVSTGHEGPEEEGLDLEGSAHPANLAIAKPEIDLRQACPLTVLVERVSRLTGRRLTTHGVRLSSGARHPVRRLD